MAQASSADTALLATRGFEIEWLRRQPGIHAPLVKQGDDSTRLDWVRDSDFRFFPALKDDLFGYRLHVADLATNKAPAAAGRREPRDILDLLYIHANHLPIGAVVWAAVGKDPGFSPESLVSAILRNARYRADDYADLKLVEPVDAVLVSQALRSLLEQAEAFVQSMPAGNEGHLYFAGSDLCQPDPTRLDDYVTHAGARRGHWPSTSQIGSAMLEGYGKPAW